MIEECWMCGKSNTHINRHHVLKREWMPKHNGTIPLCYECHGFVHGMLIDWRNPKYRPKNITNSRLLERLLDLKIRNNKLLIKVGEIKSKPFNGSKWVRFK